MYLHLGQDVIVNEKTVVGIFDIETTSTSAITRDSLKKAQKAGNVVSVGQELPKSFIVSVEKGQTVIYISPISSTTLLKRTAFLDGLANV